MKLPIWHEAVQAVSHDVTSALDPPATHHQPTQETPMSATLADAIHQAILDAVDATVADIVDRYLTPQNLAHALADGLDALPAHGHALTGPPVTQPVPPPADMAQPGDADAEPAPDSTPAP